MEPLTIRSFTSCWICRLRRKRCDQKRPICDICSSLMIACHFDDKKPEWMDGGAEQESMIEALKLEVNENAQHRCTVQISPVPLVSDPPVDGTGTCSQSLARMRLKGPYCTPTAKETQVRSAIARSDRHYQMGEALRSLRDEGILIVGAGMAVHNLQDYGKSRGSRETMPRVFPIHLHSVASSWEDFGELPTTA
ncbi:hypothetical protein G6011_11467 [Alternaria panax]|uniref:Zn(2)-C6 fungal-type domain-containing protein n=1 Tax=Alternaria panax TaxID=48097 RepID=A0AAD4IDW3_9PLEO|nr:hypothetical protein G6011_11467 [Alternaria panax]